MSGGRESNRIRDVDKKRVLDEVTRQRRVRKALEALEQDNFHEDPHADLVMSKKLPKFHDSVKGVKDKNKSKRKSADYYRSKYRKNFMQLLEEEKIQNPDPPNYSSALAPEPTKPARHFCAVCGNFSKYSCIACGTRYCCLRCLNTHQDTRCLKWTS